MPSSVRLLGLQRPARGAHGRTRGVRGVCSLWLTPSGGHLPSLPPFTLCADSWGLGGAASPAAALFLLPRGKGVLSWSGAAVAAAAAAHPVPAAGPARPCRAALPQHFGRREGADVKRERGRKRFKSMQISYQEARSLHLPSQC